MNIVVAHYKEVLNAFSILPPYAPPTPEDAACVSEFTMHECRCGKCSTITTTDLDAGDGLKLTKTRTRDEMVSAEGFGKGKGKLIDDGKVQPVVGTATVTEAVKSSGKCGE